MSDFKLISGAMGSQDTDTKPPRHSLLAGGVVGSEYKTITPTTAGKQGISRFIANSRNLNSSKKQLVKIPTIQSVKSGASLVSSPIMNQSPIIPVLDSTA